MSYRTNVVIILILTVSFLVNIVNIYGWFNGYALGELELTSSMAVVMLWFISSLYMGYKKDGIFFIFFSAYWGLGIILSVLSYILNVLNIDFYLIISVIVCFMYTGQLYGIGSSVSENVHFNPSIGVLLIIAVCFISLIGFFSGMFIRKRLPLSRI